MRSFKICHIGCGGMSLRGHGPALKKYASEYSDIVLFGCCDLDLEKATEFASLYGFDKVYTDWKMMLDELKPNAVSLVVPVKFTSEIAIEIISLGYNLLTEKPPGMTVKECADIINATKHSNVKTAAAFNRRYMPLVKRLSKMLNDKEIEHICYDFFRNGRKDADFSTTSIHGIDTVKMLSGSNYRTIDIEYQPLESTPVGNIFMNGVMESGTTISINFYPDSGLTAERAMVTLGGETYFLNIPIWDCPDYPGSILHYKSGALEDEIIGESDDMFITSGFYDEHKDFYEAVRRDLPVSHEIDDSLQSIEIMELIRHKKSKL
ncbi:MAG: Gfo/Idh/MocA family oxidoreductase [Clostridiales bacterium]|nr:Gfo/Idh/MocA family oxidoreductase [Clostridiales bacterium]